MMFKPLVAALLPFCLLAICGCGGSKQAPTKKITGTVTLNGQPLTKGTVLFVPEKGRAARGEIRSDGAYALGTYGSADGVVMGKHRVAVICREEAPPVEDMGVEIPRAGASLIPEHYSDTATSGLTFEVADDGPSTFDIQLTRQAKGR